MRFYDAEESFPSESIAEFLSGSLRAGGAAVGVVSAAHRGILREELEEQRAKDRYLLPRGGLGELIESS